MQSPVLEFDKKNCTHNAYFLQKLIFAFFKPKNQKLFSDRKLFQNTVNFSLLQCTYLDKN